MSARRRSRCAILVFEPGTHLAASAVRDALADGFAASR
ncbi:MAG: hypothetical protein QOF20_3286, partial [Acidimicrobiaceae bacterium]|nr:hypothetical protein [Acidimicrobiaceae bacterium]